MFHPSSLVFIEQLQQDVITVEGEDGSYITGMQPGDTVLKILSEIPKREHSQVSSGIGRRIYGVLPGEFFKGFALLYACA